MGQFFVKGARAKDGVIIFPDEMAILESVKRKYLWNCDLPETGQRGATSSGRR